MNLLSALLCIALIFTSHFVLGQPTNAPDSSAAARRKEFYQHDQVQTIELTIAKKEMQRLQAALPKRIYVPATFRWRDATHEKVAVRFKGNSSSSPNQKHKRSFLIRFDKYDSAGRFFGLRRVSLDNAVQFGSLFSEPIITDILLDLKIKTHRCNYAKLQLNGEYQGVYVNVERLDESFVRNHFPGDVGPLFKVDEGGPACNLQFIGDNPVPYEQTFEAKTDAAKQTHAPIVRLIKDINEVPDSDFAKFLGSNIELDDFLRVSAVMLFSGAFDQLTGWNPHNYYLYSDPQHGRWRYLPWDLDVGFSEVAFGRIQVLADWNASWPVAPSGRPNPLMERIVANPELLKRYRRVAKEILDEYFEPEQLCQKFDAKYRLIKDHLQSDPFPHRRITNPGDNGYESIVASMKMFVRKRYTSASAQLKKPGPRPKIEHRQPAGHNLQQQFERKIRQIQLRAEKLQRDGHDMRPLHQIMQRFGPLMQQSKHAEAEEVLAEARKWIERAEKSSPE